MFISRRYLADFDWVLLALALAAGLFGVVEISSVEPFPGHWQKQLINIGVGVLLLFFVTFVDYRTIVHFAPFFYGAGIVLLLLVLGPLGKVKHGNRSWLDLGYFGLQPSEFAKIFTLLMLTYFLAQVRKRPLDLRTLVIAGIIWIVPVVLVFLQNDTGSSRPPLASARPLPSQSGTRPTSTSTSCSGMRTGIR